jgi:hypothetical protein
MVFKQLEGPSPLPGNTTGSNFKECGMMKVLYSCEFFALIASLKLLEKVEFCDCHMVHVHLTHHT